MGHTEGTDGEICEDFSLVACDKDLAVDLFFVRPILVAFSLKGTRQNRQGVVCNKVKHVAGG